MVIYSAHKQTVKVEVVKPAKRTVEFTQVGPVPPSPQPRQKSSVASGVASFLRKATGRKVLKSPEPSSSSSKPLKRNFLPQLLSKKSSTDALSVRSSSSVSRQDSLSLASSRKASLTSESDSSQPPLSPRQKQKSASKGDSSQFVDIFEDGDLHTTKDIRQAIIDTEIGGKKMVEAFDSLERSAVERIQRHNLHRRPSTSSPRSPRTSPTSPSFTYEKTLKRSASTISNDLVSIRSGHSGRTSQSLRSQHLHPPRPSLHTQLSASSIKSHSSSYSRSTGHLPLERLVESEVSEPQGVDPGELVELSDIRKRRQEVISRYEARVEYLRARLKGAELHEKLMRR